MVITQDYIKLPVNNSAYRIFLAPSVAKERIRYAIPTSVFTTICRSIPQNDEEREVSFFNLEHNVLLYVAFQKPNQFFFNEIKILNLESGGSFRTIDTPEEDDAFDPVFFKSYVDGRKVFLEKKMTSKIKKLSVDTRDLAFEDYKLKDGFYSTFLPNQSHLVVDFHVYGGDIFVCNFIKPDFMKFGLFLYQN